MGQHQKMPVPDTKQPKEQKRRKPRFYGIQEDARALGVSRFHLLKVLRGTRSSPGLVERYRQLQAQRENEFHGIPPAAPVPHNRMVRGVEALDPIAPIETAPTDSPLPMNTATVSELLALQTKDAAELAALLEELPKIESDYGQMTRLGNPTDEAALRLGTALRTRIDFSKARIVNLESSLKTRAVPLEAQAHLLARRASKILVERREQKMDALAKAIEKIVGDGDSAQSFARMIAGLHVGKAIPCPEVFQKLSKAINRISAQTCSTCPDAAEGARQLLNQIKIAGAEAGELK